MRQARLPSGLHRNDAVIIALWNEKLHHLEECIQHLGTSLQLAVKMRINYNFIIAIMYMYHIPRPFHHPVFEHLQIKKQSNGARIFHHVSST